MNEPFEASVLPEIDEVLADPAASFWLKAALHSALSRDPVDAANGSYSLLITTQCALSSRQSGRSQENRACS